MAVTGIIAPNPKFYVNDACGNPAVGGWVITLDAVTGLPKVTYSDPALTIPNPPKMAIGSDGAVIYDLYWAVGDGENLYTVLTYDSSGNLIDRFQNYPIVDGSGGGSVTTVVEAVNFARNEQFAFWHWGDSFDNDVLPVGTTQIADDWYFTRSNTDATIAISKYVYPAGVNLVPFSPANALRYEVTVASADANSDITQQYESVQTLNNEQVTVLIYAYTNDIGTTAQISLFINQNFGSGGSASVETIIDTFDIDDTPNFYTATFTVPSIGGKVIGTDGDDYLEIGYRFNPVQIQDVLITDVQFQLGAGTGVNYPYITEDEQYVKLIANVLAGYNEGQGTYIIGWSATETLKEFLTSLALNAQNTNFLIGWNFVTNPNQFGETIASVDSGVYVCDQTIVVSDGDGVVAKSSFIGDPLTLEVLISSKKFGIFQIIETINSAMLQEKYASMLAEIGTTSTCTIKIALLGWTGTVDQQLRDCVSSWNPAGTNPTLATGWNYVSEVKEFDIDNPNSGNFIILENQLMDTSSSFGFLVWVDSANLIAGDYFYGYTGSVAQGANATKAQALPFQTVLAQCQRYYYRTYAYTETIGVGAITNSNAPQSIPPSGIDTEGVDQAPLIFPTTTTEMTISSSMVRHAFPVEMWKSPPIVVAYDPYTGGSSFSHLDFNGFAPLTGSVSLPVIVENITTQEVNFYISNGGFYTFATGTKNFAAYYYHLTADAKLGV